MGGLGEWLGWVEEWRLKLTSAKVEVEVEAELGNFQFCFSFLAKSCVTVSVCFILIKFSNQLFSCRLASIS